MKCCGVNSYKDFLTTKTEDWRTHQPHVSTKLDAPVVCCVNTPPGTADGDFSCAREATLDINNEVRTFVLRYVCNTLFINEFVVTKYVT